MKPQKLGKITKTNRTQKPLCFLPPQYFSDLITTQRFFYKFFINKTKKTFFRKKYDSLLSRRLSSLLFPPHTSTKKSNKSRNTKLKDRFSVSAVWKILIPSFLLCMHNKKKKQSPSLENLFTLSLVAIVLSHGDLRFISSCCDRPNSFLSLFSVLFNWINEKSHLFFRNVGRALSVFIYCLRHAARN